MLYLKRRLNKKPSANEQEIPFQEVTGLKAILNYLGIFVFYFMD